MRLDPKYFSDAVRRRNPGIEKTIREAEGKRQKHNNEKVFLDGRWFDSRKETNRYVELKWALSAGIITKLELQPKFLLQEGYRCQQTRQWIKPIHYIADFRITYPDGSQLVIDTKGFRTDVYKLKLKMFREKYPDVNFREE